MTAKKAALFGDTATGLRIRTITDPAVPKALGRTVAGFDKECWDRHRYDIVFTANMHKFMQNPELRRAPRRAVAAHPNRCAVRCRSTGSSSASRSNARGACAGPQLPMYPWRRIACRVRPAGHMPHRRCAVMDTSATAVPRVLHVHWSVTLRDSQSIRNEQQTNWDELLPHVLALVAVPGSA